MVTIDNDLTLGKGKEKERVFLCTISTGNLAKRLSFLSSMWVQCLGIRDITSIALSSYRSTAPKARFISFQSVNN